MYKQYGSTYDTIPVPEPLGLHTSVCSSDEPSCGAQCQSAGHTWPGRGSGGRGPAGPALPAQRQWSMIKKTCYNRDYIINGLPHEIFNFRFPMVRIKYCKRPDFCQKLFWIMTSKFTFKSLSVEGGSTAKVESFLLENQCLKREHILQGLCHEIDVGWKVQMGRVYM
jgi:hypothetical protein